MIYCQLNPRAKAAIGQAIRLSDVARITGCTGLETLPIPCPDRVGVWRLNALTVVRLVRQAIPDEELTMLGDNICYIHRVRANHADPTKPLRTIAAFAILAIGSALGLAWFHSDVDMPGAMERVYTLITGQPVTQSRLITIPYIIGVALGVSVFYAIPFPKEITPLEVKLSEYQQTMEAAEGEDFPDE